MSQFALIAFDLDGTLINTEALTLPDMVNCLKDDFGIPMTLEHFLENYHGMSGQPLMDKLNAEYGTNLEFSTFLPIRNARLPGVFGGGIPPAPGMLQALRLLASQGRQLCVCSNSDAARIALSLGKVNGQHSAGVILEHMFEGHIFSATAAGSRAKPAPDVYLAAAACYKTGPKQCLAVEDSATGAKSAVEAGFTCVGYLGLSQNAAHERSKMEKAGVAHFFTHWDDFHPLLSSLENGAEEA